MFIHIATFRYVGVYIFFLCNQVLIIHDSKYYALWQTWFLKRSVNCKSVKMTFFYIDMM